MGRMPESRADRAIRFQQIQLNPTELADSVMPYCLSFMEHYHGMDEVLASLVDIDNGGLVDVQLTAEKVIEYTQHVTTAYAKDFRDKAANGAKLHFLDDATKVEQVSPNKFIKQHKLPGSYRPQLRAAEEAVYRAAGHNLSEEIKEDDSAETLTTPVTQDEAVTVISETLLGLAEGVLLAAETVKAMFANHLLEEPTSRPTPKDHIERNNEDIALDALATVLTLRSNVVLTAEHCQVFDQLRNALLAYKSREARITSAVDVKFTGEVVTHVHSELAPQYAAMEAAAKERLSDDLHQAYSEAAGMGLQYKAPRPKQSTSEETVTEVSAAAEAAPEAVTELGPIPSPFPWTEGDIQPTVQTNSENTIIACDAQLPALTKIGKKLRQRSGTGNTFDRMWTQIQQIELHNQADAHPSIAHIRNASAPELADLTVVSYVKSGHNAKRVYYARTTASHYPKFAQQLTQQGIKGDPTVLILLAETDIATKI